MTTKHRVLPALLFSLAAAFGSEAQAAQFSAVCSFGDSLSDAGYYRPFLRAIGIPEALVQQLGSFTTNPDPVWTELLAQYYGITPNPSNVAGGCIYAQGGARVTQASASTPPNTAQRPMSTQITEYLAANGGHADPNALYTVWIGANDFLQNSALFSAGAITQTEFQNNVLAAATAEVQLIGQLRAAGARYIMVASMPNLGLTPASLAGGAAAAAGATQLAAGYNTTLWTSLSAAGIKVIPIDTFTLLNEVKANAAAFGFTNTTGVACGVSPLSGNNSSQFCLPNTLVAANANNTFMFADSVHPSGALQAMLAQFAISMIEGPYNYGQLAEAPLRTRALHVQGVTDGLANGHLAEIGRWTVFASGGGGNYDVDTFPGNTGISHDNTSYTLGATIRTSESVTLGAAWGQTRASASFASSGGDYRARDNNYSLFGSLKAGHFWATGIATIGNITYSDIRRNIVIGPVLRTATASTSGSNASAVINAGYDFAFGRFLIGPTVGAAFQDVEVSGFDEANAASSNLRIGTQNRRSQVLSGGLRASMDLGGWTPWIKVTADKENNNDERFVNALPLTLATTNNNYDIAAFRGDTTYTTISAGVRGWIMPKVGLGVAYYKVQGRSNISEQGASATVSVRF